MKRALLTIMTSTALLAAMPALALARHDEHHKRHHHHARIRRDRVGRDSTTGVNDGRQDAGTVTSFRGGTLVITLADGSTLSGAVTNATELRCDGRQGDEMQTDDRGQGTDGGPGSGDRGQGDNGDQGDDRGPGDDQGGDGRMCPVMPGMIVREAELTISSAGAIWDEVEFATER